MANRRTIVDAQEVLHHLDDPAWIIVDCRYNPQNPLLGYQSFIEGHLPGARFADLSKDLAGSMTRFSGRHPLPEAKKFISTLRALGVSDDSQIIAYDSSGSVYSSRLWWMCQWVGHRNAAVLDGGWKHWCKIKAPISCGEVDKKNSTLGLGHLIPDDSMWVDTDFVEQVFILDEYRLIDARLSERFLGNEVHLEKYCGHIPGAINHQYVNNLDDSECFLPPDVLKGQLLRSIGNVSLNNVIHQCGAGITACNNLLAMELAGLSGSRFYPGSWSEWCSTGKRPMMVK